MLFRKEPAQSALRPNDCLATLKFSKLPKTLRHRENPSKTYKKTYHPKKKTDQRKRRDQSDDPSSDTQSVLVSGPDPAPSAGGGLGGGDWSKATPIGIVYLGSYVKRSWNPSPSFVKNGRTPRFHSKPSIPSESCVWHNPPQCNTIQANPGTQTKSSIVHAHESVV